MMVTYLKSKSVNPENFNTKERILPDGIVELVFIIVFLISGQEIIHFLAY